MSTLKFQYPLRVEVGCNPKRKLRQCCSFRVSVPSTGRSGLQRGAAYKACIRALCFSTLYGSKWVATLPPLWGVGLRMGFSTLYGSKWVATTLMRSPFSVMTSFSTLYGSKWVATDGVSRSAVRDDRFQYPLRVEVGCNRKGFAASCYTVVVSVPSTGRSGLQLPSNPTPRTQIESFSTLYGSKWVATRSTPPPRPLSTKFQYPLRVEVGCNLCA